MPDVRLELDLDPVLASAGTARAAVVSAARAWGVGRLADDLSLCVTEVVTNAILHARTRIEVRARPVGDGVRVEVADGSTRWPVLNSRVLDAGGAALSDETGMTGRGLLVVEALADAWGVQPRPEGKQVWFEVGTGALTAPPGRHSMAPVLWSEGRRPVRLVALPVRLALANEAGIDDLIRELQVVTLGESPAGGPAAGPGGMPPAGPAEAPAGVPGDLLATVDGLLKRLGELFISMRDHTERAATDRRRLVDVDLNLPAGTVRDLWQLLAVLDQVAALSRSGALLNLEPGAELSAFRRWLITEVIRQEQGAPPVACPFPVEREPATVPGSRERPAAGAIQLAAERLAAVHRLGQALAPAVYAHDVAAIAAEAVMAGAGASTITLCVLQPDGETIVIVRTAGYDHGIEEHWRRFSVSDDLPGSEAIRTGQAVYVATLDERNRRYPVFVTSPVIDDPALAVLPLISQGERVLGALALGFTNAHRFSVEERAFLDSIAGQVAQALHRALLFESERAATARFAFLAEATAMLAGAEDPDSALTALARMAVPRLGEWCSVHLRQPDGEVRFLTATHVRPDAEQLAAEVHRRWPVRLDSQESAIARCLRTGEEARFQVTSAAGLAASARSPQHLEVLRSLGMASGMVIPVVGGGRVLGAMAFANASGRVVENEDLRLARVVGERAGEVLERHAARERSAEASAGTTAGGGAPAGADAGGTVAAQRPAGAGGTGSHRRASDRHLRATLEVAEHLSRAPDTPSAWEAVVPVMADLFGWDMAALWQPDEHGNLGCTAVWESRPALAGVSAITRELSLRPGTGLPGWAFTEGRPVMADLSLPGQVPHRREEATAAGIRSAMAFPLSGPHGPVAAFEMFWSEPPLDEAAVTSTAAGIGAQLGQFLTRMAAEELLRYRAALLESQLEASAEGILVVSPGRRVLAANRRFADLWPMDPDLVRIGAPSRPILAAALQQLADPDAFDEAVEWSHTHPEETLRVTLALRDGRVLEGYAAPVVDDAGGYHGRVWHLRDDSDRRAADAALATLAETLQRTLLPPELPQPPGLEAAAWYRAGGLGNEVGGDFYDLFAIRADTWGATIGDVCGRGAAAAAVTSLARHTIRASAVHLNGPSEVLAAVNRALLADQTAQRSLTAVQVELQPASGQVRLACAGHPLPLLVRPDGTVMASGCPGTLLGVLDDPVMTEVDLVLDPGDAIVLYTDGLSEARDAEGRQFGEGPLAEVLAGLAGASAGALAAGLEDALDRFAGGASRDDVAVLVVCRPAA